MTGEYTTELDGRAEPLLGPELGLPEDSPLHSDSSRHKLEMKAVDGTIFVGLTTAGSMALRLVNSLIFAYLFLPAYFGLLSLVTACTSATRAVCSNRPHPTAHSEPRYGLHS